MSRRCHHGSPRHVRGVGRERPRTAPAERGRAAGPAQAGAELQEPTIPTASMLPSPMPVSGTPARTSVSPHGRTPAEGDATEPRAAAEAESERGDSEPAPASQPIPRNGWPARPHQAAPLLNGHASAPARDATHAANGADHGDVERGTTAPQLRRFIKSRAYVPMHELRRRFAINGGDDEVTPVDLERQRVFVGLPEREGRLLGELLRGGDIGYELSLDPISPIVVGVYPMRPVTRA